MPARRTPIQAEDIYSIRQPFDLRLSPDGTRLAVVVRQADRKTLKNLSHIWMVTTSGSVPPQQFTQGAGGDSSPRFSPDGRHLAFISARSGKSEIWIMPIGGGEARQLTKLEGIVTDHAFAPDGKKVVAVFTPLDEEAKAREVKKKRGEPGSEAPQVRAIERIFYKLDGSGFIPKGRAHLWLIDVESGRGRQLTSDDHFDEYHPVYSPDGQWIYFNSNRSADPDIDLDREQIWRIPARGGTPQRVRTFDGPSSNFSISPDGAWIAFLGREDPDAPWNTRHTKLWLVPSRGGRPVELSARLDRSCENSTISDTFGTGATPPPVWSRDSRWIYFLVTNEGNTEIWRGSIDRSRPEPVMREPGAVIDFAIDFASRSLYATFSDLSTPGELYRFTHGSRKGEPERMSHWNDWLDRRRVSIPEEFWLEAKGRHRIQGWVLPPTGRAARTRGGKLPAVLYIHGGPATQYGRVFFHEFQYLAGRGYTVFYCNPRGGTGYSEKHMASIVNAWGTIDYDDLMRFTDSVLRRHPEIDRRRLGVAGGSYGGYMTNWIIGHTTRFAAAVTQRSVTNLMSFSGTSDFGYAWPKEMGGEKAWRDPLHYLQMSPISYVDTIRAATLIEHHENDHRCPIEQAEQLFAALKARKIPVEFHRYPEESHGMSRGGRPDRRVSRCERVAGWFDRWLPPRGNGGRRTG